MKAKEVLNFMVRLMFLLSVFGLDSNALSNEKSQWPRHRGDAALNGNSGQKIGTSLKLEWVFDAGDFLKSSVVVSGGVAFVGADTGIIHAVDIETGKEKWQYKTGMGIEAPPLVHDGIVYIGSTDGFLYAFDAGNDRVKTSKHRHHC